MLDLEEVIFRVVSSSYKPHQATLTEQSDIGMHDLILDLSQLINFFFRESVNIKGERYNHLSIDYVLYRGVWGVGKKTRCNYVQTHIKRI